MLQLSCGKSLRHYRKGSRIGTLQRKRNALAAISRDTELSCRSQRKWKLFWLAKLSSSGRKNICPNSQVSVSQCVIFHSTLRRETFLYFFHNFILQIRCEKLKKCYRNFFSCNDCETLFCLFVQFFECKRQLMRRAFYIYIYDCDSGCIHLVPIGNGWNFSLYK